MGSLDHRLAFTDLPRWSSDWPQTFDGVGRTFEALVWTPEKEISDPVEIQTHFQKNGFDENTIGGFLFWVLKNLEMEAACCVLKSGQILATYRKSCVNVEGGMRFITFSANARNLALTENFVAFREVTTP